MAHISHTATRSETTPPEWLPLGRQLGELANAWSNRTDLLAYVGENAGGGAPACYNPALAEIEVNLDVAFGATVTPEMVGDFDKRRVQYEFPRATGALYHEAFHAEFSGWDMPDAMEALEPDEYKALTLLEESRIEWQGSQQRPRSLPFLRACAMDLVIADASEGFETMPDTQKSAWLVGLIHTRIEMEILDPEDVKDITDLVDAFLGKEMLGKLLEIARKFRECEDHADAAPVLYPLAREWAKLVREKSIENGEPQPGDGGELTEEQMKDILSALGDFLSEAMKEAGEASAVSSQDDLSSQEQSENWKEEAEVRTEQAKESAENKEASDKTFKTVHGTSGGTNSVLVEKREPTDEEHRAAVVIAQGLERAKYRERGMTTINSSLPPGRLRTRALIQGKALKAKGVRQSPEPWRRKVRKQTDTPTLTVGMMVDISGSMGDAMEPMASAAWIMSEAVRRVQGRTAMVYYGNSVFPVLKPGQHLDKVSVYSARDGYERFDEGFRSLDGGLDLLHGDGARLLVVASDGQYKREELPRREYWLDQCRKHGVAVLWLPFGGVYDIDSLLKAGVGVMKDTLTVTDSALNIGREAARVLTEVGKRNA